MAEKEMLLTHRPHKPAEPAAPTKGEKGQGKHKGDKYGKNGNQVESPTPSGKGAANLVFAASGGNPQAGRGKGQGGKKGQDGKGQRGPP